ncbi:MAG: adenine deaminase [Bacteroidia bacterium]|nr:adenine deaminase [Bacteroidia bacterium]
MMKLSGNIVDVISRKIFKGEIEIINGRISDIRQTLVAKDIFIMPGLIDSHVHIESSMLVPSRFAEIVVRHGTIATVSDPHEIANVMGIDGIDFMIGDIRNCYFKMYFGAPSCVPATGFETSGAVISVEDIKHLLARDDIYYLSEMMNYPGVIFNDPEVLAKIDLSKKAGKPVDGHAPGLTGDDLVKYVSAGIETDHECFTLHEAIEKINLGMKILIREGSSARNFGSLYRLIDDYPDMVMLCTDDAHPDDLVKGHINKLIKAGIEKNNEFFNLIRAVTCNPVKHYGLPVGLLQIGDPADFILVDDLTNFNILKTYINGHEVFDGEFVNIGIGSQICPNKFFSNRVAMSDLKVKGEKGNLIKVIVAIDGELITKTLVTEAKIENECIIQDIEDDILKIAVLNRYEPANPVKGFIKNFGLKNGAIAGSIAHDSHNVIAVGTNDEDIMNAMNMIIEANGGICFCAGNDREILPLEVAGLMTNQNANIVAEKYKHLENKARQNGASLKSPFMTLSFMALLVIPELKIGDKGLFDGIKFSLTNLLAE